MKIGRPRNRFLHAMLDVGGGRSGVPLDLDQVVD
jgi:hypothetical protein